MFSALFIGITKSYSSRYSGFSSSFGTNSPSLSCITASSTGAASLPSSLAKSPICLKQYPSDNPLFCVLTFTVMPFFIRSVFAIFKSCFGSAISFIAISDTAGDTVSPPTAEVISTLSPKTHFASSSRPSLVTTASFHAIFLPSFL